METADIKKIIEALLFVADQPVSEATLKYVLGELSAGQDIGQLVKEIGAEYEQRNSPMELRFVADGWQFSTKKEFNSWVRKLFRDKTTLKLSNSALETLSVVAYKQPITRSEIEEIRGVEVSGVLETLLERKLVKIVGRKETIGRPLLYGTTQEFLRHFGLSHLSELPSLEDLAAPEESAAEPDSSETGETGEDVSVQPDLPEPESEPAQEVEPKTETETETETAVDTGADTETKHGEEQKPDGQQ
jgi:segregation and condensation protein B